MSRISLLIAVSLLVVACGGGGSSSGGGTPTPPPAPTPLPPMFQGSNVVQFPMAATTPANPGSPYAAVLTDCVFSNTRSQSCNFGTLPLLGTQTRNPTIDDVMNRVIVSHAWMGPRIREILEALPPDMLLLFRGVTAMVVSRDVRPSFYWTATGAIYIDPDYIWLTPAERQQGVSTRPDFRSSFGLDLQFAMPWRYVRDNALAYSRPPFGQEVPRTLDDLIVDIGRLLYHELAHANDFYPVDRQQGYSSNQTPANAVIQPIISDLLIQQLPLQSSIMRGLAQVRFQGTASTATQRGYTQGFVATEFFDNDAAPMFYSYSTPREDLAMLFEILMMRYHFGVETDHAVTNNAAAEMENPTSSDYIVARGQRNRIGDPDILERARFVVVRLLPEVETAIDAYIDTVPGPREMNAGQSWAANLALDPGPVGPLGLTTQPRNLSDAEQSVQELPGYH